MHGTDRPLPKVEFSDDEKEAEYRRQQKSNKRKGAGSSGLPPDLAVARQSSQQGPVGVQKQQWSQGPRDGQGGSRLAFLPACICRRQETSRGYGAVASGLHGRKLGPKKAYRSPWA